MRLQKLSLENFRPFRGKQEIVFSDLDERNVTVIHAENGFGKTTLLNALLWGFFGHGGLTDDLGKKQSLVHVGVAARNVGDPESVGVEVGITFEHDSRRYQLRRSLTLAQQMANHKDTELELSYTDAGQTFTDRGAAAQAHIKRILPTGMSRLLFFNGERIDHLAMEQSAPQITAAIRQMLGLELLQRGIDDLQHNSVRGKLLRDLKDKTSDEKAALIERLEKLEQDILRDEEKKKIEEENLDATDRELAANRHKLLANQKTQQLQQRRDELESQRRAMEARMQEVVKKLSSLLAEDGYSLFAGDLVKRGRQIVSSLRENNMIPAPVIDSFLQELLDAGLCICERHLPPGSAEYEAVRKRLSVAPNQQFNNAVGQLENAMGIIETARTRARQNLDDLNRERLRLDDDIRHHDAELKEIHQKLGGKDDEEVQNLEATRKKLELTHDEIVSKLGAIKNRLENHRAQCEQLKAQIDRLEEKEEHALRAKRRYDAVETAIATLRRILDIETRELRPLLNKEIADHFEQVIDRDYTATLSDDFKLQIVQQIDAGNGKQVTVDVAQSTGQRQVTSLVFIASLVALAKRRGTIRSIVSGVGDAEYPIVMDSPFGQLSTQFRTQIARLVPSLAPQVILFASATQYEGSVDAEFKKSKRVGKRYYLSYHGPNTKEHAEPKLHLDGKELTQYTENPEEFTQIVEVE